MGGINDSVLAGPPLVSRLIPSRYLRRRRANNHLEQTATNTKRKTAPPIIPMHIAHSLGLNMRRTE